MLSVTNKTLMLNVIRLNGIVLSDIMLNVMAPLKMMHLPWFLDIVATNKTVSIDIKPKEYLNVCEDT
jgi:hypothetical protein